MKIKDGNGNEVNVGGPGQAALNTVLGAIGTAGSLGIMSGLFVNGNNRNQSDGDRPVTRFEMGLMMDTIQKEVEIAEMKAKMDADEKMNAMEKKQMEFNATQLAYNATTNGMMTGLQAQISQMQALAKMIIPSTNVVDVAPVAASSQSGN